MNARQSGERRRPAPEWAGQLRRRITRPEQLPDGFALQESERRWFDAAGREIAGSAARLPFAVTRHYAGLVDPADPEDPIRRQFMPRVEELRSEAVELSDPLGEEHCQPVPGLLHRYPDRALLLVSDRCAAYCRHCFRRGSLGQGGRAPGTAHVRAAARYVAAHPEVRELILSGGDPLSLSDTALGVLVGRFRSLRPDLALRIHSRVPVVLPARVDAGLLRLMRHWRPVRLVVQVNHSRELSPATRAALLRLQAAGVPVLNQAVLLRGVNDRLETLEQLMRELGAAGIRPYYLFQPDLAEGTAHLRPPLRRSLDLVDELRRRLPQRLIPAFAVDLPGGGGKVRLDGPRPSLRGGAYVLRGRDGREAVYPAD